MSADGFTELDQFSIDENSVRLLSYKFCVQNYVVILGVVDPDKGDPVTAGVTTFSEVRRTVPYRILMEP